VTKKSSYFAILRIGNSIQELFDVKDKDRSQLTQLLHLGLKVMESEARGDEVFVIKANKIQDQEDVDAQKINDALSAIAKLNSIVCRAQEVSKEFNRMQNFLLRSVPSVGRSRTG
jgi:hypothetical protein